MDYKYIEQLLELYWECETSIEEEHILRTFFNQKEVPAHLNKYKALFEYERHQSNSILGTNFDKRLLEMVDEMPDRKQETVIKAHRMTLNYRLRPLYRAAAIVAVFLLIGGGIQYTFNRPTSPKGWDYNAANYQDTYRVPQEAFEASMGGIEEIQDLLRTSDSISHEKKQK